VSKISENQVLEALRTVIDPDLDQDIVSLGFVQDLTIEGGKVRFRLVLTTPACPMKNKMKSESERAVLGIEGAESVEVVLDAKTCVSRKPEERLPGVRNIVLIGSGKGGVGKSTVALNLATALEVSGASVGIMDADIYGPSIPPMLGLHSPPSVESGKMIPPESHGMQVMSIGFLVRDEEALVWRGPILHKVLMQFVEDVEWKDLDYLIVDLPPGTGDVQLSIAQIVKPSGVLLVTTPQDIAFRDVRRAATMFQKISVPVIGLVENMSTFICPHCGTETEIFPCSNRSDVRNISPGFDVEVLARIPIEPVIAQSCETGTPLVLLSPGSKTTLQFQELAGRVARKLAIMSKGPVGVTSVLE
jgi:ATP-binding protein involved in chromosome partitioning